MSKHDITGFYKEQLASETILLTKLQNRKSVFAWLRLGAIMAIIVAFYLLWSAGWPYVLGASIILLIIFIRLVYADIKHYEQISRKKIKIQLYEKELECLNGHSTFDGGDKYSDPTHPYSSDLDIFGNYSLYQYLNRTTSEPGGQALAEFLKSASSKEVIILRQEAIKDLATRSAWIKDLQVIGTQHGLTLETKTKLESWASEAPSPITSGIWRWLRFLLPSIIISISVLAIIGILSGSVFIFSLLVFMAIVYQLDKVVAPIHRKLDNIAAPLKSFSSSVELIERNEFNAALLVETRKKILDHQYATSNAIRRLGIILERLDLRYNFVISLPLNILLLWNLQQLFELEKWKRLYKSKMGTWLDVLAIFEALNSLAVFSFNHKGYVFPEIVDNYFEASGVNIGHPLIQPQKRVDNPLDIPAAGKVMLVTGSNMAGKSTYLRSVGVNCVLAFCGAPVCADKFTISLVQIISSMRITDNLQESTSTFYAELKKLKAIIDKINSGERVFVLLDEMLRGTNSLDRHTGSKALIKQLIAKRTAAIIATHDLELAQMDEPFAERIVNYHFDVQVENEELYFDYKLKSGVCHSMNASVLMKKIGIEM